MVGYLEENRQIRKEMGRVHDVAATGSTIIIMHSCERKKNAEKLIKFFQILTSIQSHNRREWA